MNRHALIICSPLSPGDTYYLPGAEADLDSYVDYFKSATGGAWSAGEITVLQNPSLSVVRSKLPTLQGKDYGVVVFGGHGKLDKFGRTILDLNDREQMDSDELRAGSPKQTLIVDCCREWPKVKDIMFTEAAVRKAAKDIAAHREEFAKRVRAASSGLCVLWSCSRGQTAGESPQGGRYTLGLLRSAELWASQQTSGPTMLSVVEAHGKAEEITKRLSGGRQTPDIERPRSGPYFPFAVYAG